MLLISFDPATASVDAVQRAAYRLAGRLAIHISASSMGCQCSVTALDGGQPDPADVARFNNEVNDQALRERIREQTGPVRNVILALAFSQVDLEDPA